MSMNWTPEQIAWLENEAPAFMEAQKAHVAQVEAAEAARQAAVAATYPRVNSSGGSFDDLWVYPSEFLLEFDTEAEAVAAVEAARAEGRHVSSEAGTGAFVWKTPGGFTASIELDPSTRYSTSDHTGGR